MSLGLNIYLQNNGDRNGAVPDVKPKLLNGKYKNDYLVYFRLLIIIYSWMIFAHPYNILFVNNFYIYFFVVRSMSFENYVHTTQSLPIAICISFIILYFTKDY